MSDDNGKVVGGDSPMLRKFPFDYGAYAFNSSLLGTVISRPSFWKHMSWAGETEFIEQIASNIEDVGHHAGDNSSRTAFVLHNKPLTDEEKNAR
jgi:hypothetical protein